VPSRRQQRSPPPSNGAGLAGGCAGAASRTVVSLLERLKIIQCVVTPFALSWSGLTVGLFVPFFCRQVQPRTSDGQYKGVWRSLARMWREEGFRGFMRGNGINCLRIVPYRWVWLFRRLFLARFLRA
jgi:solute carrier family 25 phosphate transporter 23/24/25/41